MAEDMGDRTEAPTPRRLEQAREKGQMAKSLDLSSAMDLIGGTTLIYYFGRTLFNGLAETMRALLGDGGPGDWLDAETATRVFTWSLDRSMMVVWPIMAIMFAVIVVSQCYQVGFRFTLQPLQPNLSKLNPVSGLGRLLGKKAAIKAMVNVGKFAIVTSLVVLFVMSHVREMAQLPMLSAMAAFGVVFQIIVKLVIYTLLLMLAIGLADWFYQKWQFTQDNKMTKNQVKDEAKMAEGDVMMKLRRLRMGRDMVAKSLQATVPKANVVVTNPTHYSVALQYDPQTMAAPVVVAKGADYLAFRIREIAREHNIPIIEKPPLARALYAGSPVGRQISPLYFEAVAEVLAYVYRINGQAEEAKVQAEAIASGADAA